MVKKLLVALLALCFANAAYAQSFPVPKDILDAGSWGSDGWDDQGFPLASGTTLNKLGNGVAVDGGTAPAFAFEFADIPTTDTANWATTNPAQIGSGNFCTLTINGGTCQQAKARFTANVTHCIPDDPIRNARQPGKSHLHCFFGNGATNAASTFQILRNKASRYSASTGGAFNGTSYWYPAVIKPNAFGDGKDYVVVPDWVTFYYTASSASITDQLTYLPLGLRYVSGFNMDDGTVGNYTSGNPWGSWLQSKVDAANAITPGRYSIKRPNDGFQAVNWGFVCLSTGQRLDFKLANADGTGSFSPACPSSSQIELQFSGAECWDGVNFWTPGGYKNVTPMVWDTVAGAFVCPNGWYRLPEFQLAMVFSHQGAADYTTWVLSSDAPGSVHGGSFHTDWFNGWDKTALHLWLDNCMGVNATPHECNDGTLASNFKLFRAEAGLWRNPQVSVTVGSGGTANASKMFLAPLVSKTGSVHMYGHNMPTPLTRILDMEGDSISVCDNPGGVDCVGGPNQYTQYYASFNDYARERSWAVGGSGINNLQARKATLLAAKPSAGTPWVVSVFTGANDLNRICTPLGGVCLWTSETNYVNAIWAYTDSLRAAGAKVVMFTVLPGGSDPPQAANFNARRAVVNPLIRAGIGTHYDALADVAADTRIGDDGDQLSTTWYTDQIHPTATAHQTVILPIYSKAVAKAFNAPQTSAVEPANDNLMLALNFDLAAVGAN